MENLINTWVTLEIIGACFGVVVAVILIVFYTIKDIKERKRS